METNFQERGNNLFNRKICSSWSNKKLATMNYLKQNYSAVVQAGIRSKSIKGTKIRLNDQKEEWRNAIIVKKPGHDEERCWIKKPKLETKENECCWDPCSGKSYNYVVDNNMSFYYSQKDSEIRDSTGKKIASLQNRRVLLKKP